MKVLIDPFNHVAESIMRRMHETTGRNLHTAEMICGCHFFPPVALARTPREIPGRTVIDFILTPCVTADLNGDHTAPDLHNPQSKTAFLCARARVQATNTRAIFMQIVGTHAVCGRCAKGNKSTAVLPRVAMRRPGVEQIGRCLNNIFHRLERAAHIIHVIPTRAGSRAITERKLLGRVFIDTRI